MREIRMSGWMSRVENAPPKRGPQTPASKNPNRLKNERNLFWLRYLSRASPMPAFAKAGIKDLGRLVRAGRDMYVYMLYSPGIFPRAGVRSAFMLG